MSDIILAIWLLLLPICAVSGGLRSFFNGSDGIDIIEAIIGGMSIWFLGTIIIIPTIAGVALLLR